MKEVSNFTTGRIFWPLVRFAFPVLMALFLQALYGAADLLIVGQFGGPTAREFVSAVSTGSQMMHALTVIITGLSMGLTVVLAEAIGAGKKERAGKIIASSIFVFAMIALIMTAITVFLAENFSLWLQVPQEALGYCVTYIQICAAGLVFIVFYNLLGAVFRGMGDSQLPLISVAIAALINIVLDYILIAWFSMGVIGAALATIIGQGLSVLISIWIIRRGGFPFPFSIRDIRWDKTIDLHMLKVGFPIALQDFLVSISFLVIMGIVNSLGLIASAGVGVAEKACGFIMLVPSAFAQSMSAFIAQNIGAGQYARANQTLLYGIATSLCAGVIIGGFTFFKGDLLTAIFSSDPQVIEAGFQYLKAYAIDCLLTSFLFCFIGYFNGCEKTTFVMIQGIVGGILVRIPVSWLMASLQPPSLFRIGLATPISSAIQILMCMVYFRMVQKKLPFGKSRYTSLKQTSSV